MLILAAKGLNEMAMAAELGLARSTVKNRWGRLFRFKLGVHTRSEAVAVALKRGFISLDDI